MVHGVVKGHQLIMSSFHGGKGGVEYLQPHGIFFKLTKINILLKFSKN